MYIYTHMYTICILSIYTHIIHGGEYTCMYVVCTYIDISHTSWRFTSTVITEEGIGEEEGRWKVVERGVSKGMETGVSKGFTSWLLPQYWEFKWQQRMITWLQGARQLYTFSYIIFFEILIYSTAATWLWRKFWSQVTANISKYVLQEDFNLTWDSPKLSCYCYIHLVVIYFFNKENGSGLPQRKKLYGLQRRMN
jgi:hypothetical protein